MVGHVGEDCFGGKLFRILGIMNSTDRREEKRNFLIEGRRFRRSFKNYCNYRYFMKLSRLLSIVKLGIDLLLSEHLQSWCINSSMNRYTPIQICSILACPTQRRSRRVHYPSVIFLRECLSNKYHNKRNTSLQWSFSIQVNSFITDTVVLCCEIAFLLHFVVTFHINPLSNNISVIQAPVRSCKHIKQFQSHWAD